MRHLTGSKWTSKTTQLSKSAQERDHIGTEWQALCQDDPTLEELAQMFAKKLSLFQCPRWAEAEDVATERAETEVRLAE